MTTPQIPASTAPATDVEAPAPAAWSVEESIETYSIDRWGLGYFSINEQGNVTVAPFRQAGAAIDLMRVVAEAREQGMNLPIVLRFQDLLRHRVVALNMAFRNAITEMNYGAEYVGVFPIKVNQLREVVEEILDAGRPFNYGIEAGSKPELFAALAIHDNPNSLVVCNGYKDTQFIRMALLGVKLGKKVVMVVEKVEEVKAIIEVGREMGVRPLIGLRVRLSSKSSGRWATSGGELAKFGLSPVDLMEAVDYLQDEGFGDTVRLVHFHIGSQIPDILSLKRATREAARYYSKLCKLGLDKIDYMDVGGGLGVDYDGSATAFHSSTNYTMEEYAADVVDNIMEICNEEGVRHPNLISESGRAIVAHHSLLVVQAFGVIEKTKAEYDLSVNEGDHKYILRLAEIMERIQESPLEALHDTQQIKTESQQAFELGFLDLREKARVDTFYWHNIEEVVNHFQQMAEKKPGSEKEIPEEVRDLTPYYADQYICNFSMFQSLLDHWAVGQLFPIMPIHRLNEKPTIASTLVDITCDSDGKVCKFTDLREDARDTLPLHPLRNNEPYYLGFFMTGAYQDIMGDLHNLFGRVNEAHVFLDPEEEVGFYIEETLPGHSIQQVLELTQYHANDLIRRMKLQVDEAIRSNNMRPNEGMRLLGEYERGLAAPTYLAFEP